jgi:hypothetical protein
MFSIQTIIAMLQAAVAAAPTVIQTAQDLYDIGAKVYAALNGTAPTAEQMAELQAQIDADVAEALTPLPDDSAG